MKDLTVVIPVYKEDNKVVFELYAQIAMLGCKIIVVDDGATMDLPDDVYQISHYPNMGYGYAIKRGIGHADTELILVCDGDGQHTADDVSKLYQVFKLIDDCAMVVGCRWNLNEKPLRWIARKCINFVASCWARHYLIDLNSGMRIFRRDLAQSYKPILCDTFSFTTSLTMALVTDNHKIAWFPINVQPRAVGKSHVRLFRDGLITMWYICWIGFALRTRRIRAWLRALRTSGQ